MAEKQKKDRYEMHKYWGKKPSKDLKALIEKYTKEGDTILDPFSGYGVFCCEAFILNRNVISNDLNPMANFINKQLLNKNINIKKLEGEWINIRNQISEYINLWYNFKAEDGDVQLINILRDEKDKPLKGRYKSKVSKKTVEVTFSDEEVANYLAFEKGQIIDDWYPVDPLIENSRISAKKGMVVADLFPKRALACHAKLLALIELLSSGNEKELLKVTFTANLANCSKLVPPIKSRGDMSQGAWMTGFYIGSTYLENNVLSYFENRLKKTIKGKTNYLECFTKNLFSNKFDINYNITQFDAKSLGIPSKSIDYIFTDPPYGDAVPYFEQSILWNSWLKLVPDYDNEIVISDSKMRDKGIDNFESNIYVAFSEIRRVLKDKGYFSLTYHSLSGLEWKSITNACINNGFEMVDFTWLIQKTFTPRQINRSKSIKGDVLVTFRKNSEKEIIYLNDLEVEELFIELINNWLIKKSLDTNEIFMRIMKYIFTNRIVINNVNLLNILVHKFEINEQNKWIRK